jgi:V/A-type H+-transporting ATPase subunit I
MITKMKKITLFLLETEVESNLTVLGQLGVMHIKPFVPARDESIDRVHTRIQQLEKAISILERFDNKIHAESDIKNGSAGEIELSEQVLHTEEKRLEKIQLAKQLSDAQEWYKTWGNVSMADIEQLKENNLTVKLYLLKDEALEKLSEREDIILIGKSGDMHQVALITNNFSDKLEAGEVELPKYNFSTLENDIEQNKADIEAADGQLKTLCAQIPTLKTALEERLRLFSVRNVQFGGIEIENQFRFFKGYIPEHLVEKFLQVAQEQNWGYLIEEPGEEDIEEVPTLIRSPKWFESIKPVMNFMGLVPGYDEIDVSRIFMLFFTFFTGVLVGDAGYGLIFLFSTIFVHSKKKFKPQIEISLMYTLSVSITVWGVLTGTYFGSEEIAKIPFLSQLIIDKLSSFGGDTVFLQKFMFFVGAIHLSIGHIQVGIRYINSVKAIAQLGWILAIWGLYFTVVMMVLGEPASPMITWLISAGAILIALFSNPGTSFFKGVISSIGGLPFSLINGFSDIISYIRLYAVGMATVLMAVSFNDMAIGDGITTVFAGIGAVIILILGHLLNMTLAAMAVIVHGVRLNMLEYSGHAGVEYSGNEYNPFKIKKTINNLKNQKS